MQLRSLQRPFSASFEITSHCDLRCVFCSARLSDYGRRDLSLDDVRRIIVQLTANGVYSIFLTGGEPLERPDLPRILEECIKREMNVTLSTNGVHADPETASAIAAAGLEEIQVSIHGTSAIHDQLVGLPGAFNRAWAGLKNLVTAGLRVTVAAVCMKSNARCLPNLARDAARAGARYFRLLRLMPNSSAMLAEVLPAEQMIALSRALMQVQSEVAHLTVRIHTAPGLPDEGFWTARERQLVHPLCHTCSAGKQAMGILSDGDCVPCLEMKPAEFVCGNILKDSLADIWNAAPMCEFRRVSPESYRGECGRCDARWTCYSARCTAYHLTGDVLGDDRTCYRFASVLEKS